jgi:hypothetical protein
MSDDGRMRDRPSGVVDFEGRSAVLLEFESGDMSL